MLQKKIYKKDIKILNDEISITREELFYAKKDNDKYKKILEKLEVLLFKKEYLLKKIKETSLNEKINCNSKIKKIFETISNKNHELKGNLSLCKEGLSKSRIEKKSLSTNNSKNIQDFNRLVKKYNNLLSENKNIEIKLSKKQSCKKENSDVLRRKFTVDRKIRSFINYSAKKIIEYGTNRVAIIDRSNTYSGRHLSTMYKYIYIREKLIDGFFNINKKSLDIVYPWEARNYIEKINKENLDYDDFYQSIGTTLKVDAILIVTNRRNEYVTLKLFDINSKETLAREHITF